MDDSTKRQFIRDCKLPITITEEPYFSYFLDLYEEHYKSRTLYDLFLADIKQLGGLEPFLEHAKKVRHNAIDFISERESYLRLKNGENMNFNTGLFSQKCRLYNQSNIGKTFVSIDLVKANVQALNFYDKDILGNSDTYFDYISKFTDSEFFKQSKQIRQIIFGSLSPKRQQKIQKHIMCNILDKLISLGFDKDKIYSSSADELVFELKDLPQNIAFSEKLFPDFKLHIETFVLTGIREDIPVFFKCFLNKEGLEIKGGSNKYMPEVIRYLKGEPLQEYDLYFNDDGRVAKYLKPYI